MWHNVQRVIQNLLSINGDLKCCIALCRESKVGEFIGTSNTIENWLDYIANSFIDKRLSNCFTEVLSNKIKVIKRVESDIKNATFIL